MSHFPDTSFLGALYRDQINSERADACMNKLPGGLQVSRLLLFEFRQSIRFQMPLHAKDRTQGYPQSDGEKMSQDLHSAFCCHRLKSVQALFPANFSFLMLGEDFCGDTLYKSWIS